MQNNNRLKTSLYMVLGLLLSAAGYGQANYTGPVNYVRTWDAVKPEVNANNITTAVEPSSFRMTTQYIDGLGRPVQTVMKKASLYTGYPLKDLVVAKSYDEFGREPNGYLPFPASGGTSAQEDGSFKPNPWQQQAYSLGSTFILSPLKGQNEGYLYSQTKFDASPLNRVTETFAPGNSWAGTAAQGTEASRRSVKFRYYANTATDLVRIWNVTNNATVGEWGTISTPAGNAGYYPAGELTKTIIVDEQGKQVIEFKNKSGQVILMKIQLTANPDDGSGSGYAGWIATYYIYDDIGNLRTILQPNAVNGIYSTWVIPENNLAQLSFRYEYDERNRLIRRHVPGADDMFYIYDARDRLVMMRDGNMTFDGKWQVIKYDPLNRPVEKGIWTNSGTPASHRLAAAGSTNYPLTPTNYEMISLDHYDDYAGLPAGLTNTFDNSWSAEFNSTYNTPPLYAEPQLASTQTIGRVTWTQSKILGTTSSFLYAVNLYDNKGRLIQVKSINQTGGEDVRTTQYSWMGLPLVTVNHTRVGSTSAQHITQVTRNSYDDLARLLKVEKKMAYGVTPGGSLSGIPYVTLSERSYDANGYLREKTVGNKKDPETGQYFISRQPLQSLKYDYNVRGWQLGMNRDWAKGDNTGDLFGYDLGYDNSVIRKSDQTQIGAYTLPAFNGNISGVTWKSDGDDAIRRYSFTYDPANRLMKADFKQYVSGTSWSSTDVNYTVDMGDAITPTSAYDGNGNIIRMKQWGLTLTGSRVIDQLTYSYYGNTLNSVAEDASIGIADFRLGDFTDRNTAGQDYGFDKSGNMMSDKNRNIIGTTGSYQGTSGPIRYNHLNLPYSVTVHTDVTGSAVKGTVEYKYSAEGIKLEKKVTESSSTVLYNGSNVTTGIVTTTNYLGNLVLESKVYTNATLNGALGYLNRLLLGGHEEGRVRVLYQNANPNTFDRFEYDYTIRDHLGNVRMVLTEELKMDAYPVASMETAQSVSEEAIYGNISTTRVNKPSGYPNDTYTNPNDKVALVKGNGNRMGPSVLLKVMAGDKFHIRANAWWTGSGSGSNTSPLSSIVSALISGAPAVSGGKIGAGTLTATLLEPQVTMFLSNQPGVTGKPKAYLNWVLFDEQFKYVGSSSGAESVEASGVFKTFNKPNMPVEKNGYLYVYVSNETDIDVFFDNLQVTHVRGTLLEESHYYPFGLIMSGLSSKALNNVPANRFKFNSGSELNEREFLDGSGLDWYDATFRGYDQQIGRFQQIDPIADMAHGYSPFTFCFNNPVLLTDPLGLMGDTTINGISLTQSEYNSGVTVVNSPRNKPPNLQYNSPNSGIVVRKMGKGGGGNGGSTAGGMALGGQLLKVNPEAVLGTAVVVGVAGTLYFAFDGKTENAFPSMNPPGFLSRDNANSRPLIISETDYAIPATDVKPVDVFLNPSGDPTKVYEIGGWDMFTLKWKTLKYGVASAAYDTYGGIGNRRPDGQLGGAEGDRLRAKYPQLLIQQRTLLILPSKALGHIWENNLVYLYRLNNNNQTPPEQGLPYGLGPK